MANIIKPPCDEGVILSGGAVVGCRPAQRRWILAATILASSMAFIDGTAVNVALPFLQQSLGATAIGVQWVIEGYSLFLSALLLVGGSLGDHSGRRKIFLAGVTIFALASVGCGLAGSVGQLILARAIQGIGGALLVPGSLSIISASFAVEERGKAIGTWSGFSAITTALGPVVGGWLIENVSWRAVFFINLPLALAVIIISLCCVPESRDREAAGALDWWGAILATAGLGGLVYGLVESPSMGFRARPVILALSLGVVALVAFLIYESRTPRPMLPLNLFRSRNFSGANLLTLLLYAALSSVLFFLPLNLIQVQNYSATAAGAAFLPFILIMFLLSRWAGGLVDRFGPRMALVVGPLICAAGYGAFMLPGIGGSHSGRYNWSGFNWSGSYWTTFFPAIVILGVGMAISVAPLTTTVMTSVSEAHAGIASGINNAVSRTAGLLAIAVLGIVMLQTFARGFEPGLAAIDIPAPARAQLIMQEVRLAGIELPAELSAAQKSQIETVIGVSFVRGFRLVSLIGAALAAAGGLAAGLMIQPGKGKGNGSRS